MCEAGEREQKSCETLLQALQGNGRCKYHEDLVKGLFAIKGGMAIVILFLTFIAYTAWGTNRVVANNSVTLVVAVETLKTHTSADAHPEMLRVFQKHIEKEGE